MNESFINITNKIYDNDEGYEKSKKSDTNMLDDLLVEDNNLQIESDK